MNAKDAIRYVLDTNLNILKMFLADLSDADLLARPVPGANHAAWQLGHLINSEVHLVACMGCKVATLPEGFGDKHSKKTASSDAPGDFLKKQEYLELFDKVRGDTIAALAGMSDSDLEKPINHPLKDLAPTFGKMFLLVGDHVMMHAGQLTTLRRKLGKPVLF